MNKQAKLLFFISGIISVSCFSVSAVIAQTRLTNQSKVVFDGIGTIKVGMTVKQASQAIGTPLNVPDKHDNSCFFVKPQNPPKGIGLMVTNGYISRIDVWKDNKVTTLSGAKIGDTEEQIKSLYPGQIQVSPHHYVQGGHYLTLISKDPAYRNYRVIFETDGKRVTQFRSGKLPEVTYIEGCS